MRRKLIWRYRVMSSFGALLTGMFTRKDYAFKHARGRSKQYPVDVWAVKGGALGCGVRLAHAEDGRLEVIR